MELIPIVIIQCNTMIFMVWYLLKYQMALMEPNLAKKEKASSVWFLFLLNFSKKVKFHLLGLNLDTGYLLYVIIWIPKAFSLPSHHPRVVFTISNGFSLGGGKNLPFVAMFHLNLL